MSVVNGVAEAAEGYFLGNSLDLFLATFFGLLLALFVGFLLALPS